MKKMIFSLMVATLTSPLGYAQESIQPPPPVGSLPPPVVSRRTPQPIPQPEIKEQTFDWDFGGGSVQQFADELGLAIGGKPPIIIPSTMGTITIPSFQLRNITMTDLFNALNILGRSENWFWQSNERRMIGPGQLSTQIWVLTKTEPPRNPPYGIQPIGNIIPQPQGVRVVPINVGYLLEKYKIEDLTTAIKSGWQMSMNVSNEEGVTPELKYHKDTELLLIKGTMAHMNFVNDMLQQLAIPLKKESANTPKSTSPAPAPAQPNK